MSFATGKGMNKDERPPTMQEGYHPWVREPISHNEMLIIAGGYRCGTTSLFACLSGHPEINPSLIKEPAFFFSLRLLEQPQISYPPGHEVWAYLSMFRKKGGRVLLEGTSNYLNDPGCAARIARGLPRAKVILLLREPVARLLSWYKFLRLQGQLDPRLGFETWIHEQMSDPRPVDQRPYPLQAVEHCRYGRYVEEYLRVLGQDRVLILWFDDFKHDPRAVMRRVCRFSGIAADYYEHYSFAVQNESMKLRRPRAFAAYRKLHRGFFRLLRPWPRLQHLMRVGLFGVVEPKILPLFTGPADPVEISPRLQHELRDYVRADLPALRALTGADAPWRAAYES